MRALLLPLSLLLACPGLFGRTTSSAYSPVDGFSLSAYQRACALETAKSLDATRMHFQVLFVDDDNAMGRIAEGLLERVAEHNDALFVLFPSSATIECSRNAPRDAAPPPEVLRVCESLGLCSERSAAMGTAFDLSHFDESDLIVVINDDIRSMILRSLPTEDQEDYAHRCRLLSEFLSPAFATRNSNDDNNNNLRLLDTLDPELRDRVAPTADRIIGSSSSVFASEDEKIDALILASAGLTRFCLDTIDDQLEAQFQRLLEKNFASLDKVPESWRQVDAQLTRCCAHVTGYFSPNQRKRRFERHLDNLRNKAG